MKQHPLIIYYSARGVGLVHVIIAIIITFESEAGPVAIVCSAHSKHRDKRMSRTASSRKSDVSFVSE